MPVREDDGRRWGEMELLVPGTPEPGCDAMYRWDDELESFEGGWPGFFEALRLYLRDFAGQPAATVRVMAEYPGEVSDGWSRLASALALTGVDVGQRVDSPSGATGFVPVVVERVHQTRQSRDVMVRLDHPGNGIAVVGMYPMGDAARALGSLYLDGAAADTSADQRQVCAPWLDGVLGRDSIVSER